MEKSKLIGLSLSFCVKDIMNGKVNIDKVKHIRSNCRNDADWNDVISHYKGIYWKDFDAESLDLVLRQIKPIVSFERKRGNIGHNIASGHWMTEDFKQIKI